MRARWLVISALAVAAPALGAGEVQIAKSVTVLSDGVSTAGPYMLPGAKVEVALMTSTPLLSSVTGLVTSKTIANVAIIDRIQPQMKLSVEDVGKAGNGPVEFTDGGLLGLGLTSSGLVVKTIQYDDDDNDQNGWTYSLAPVGGFDPKVRRIKVTLQGTAANGGSFRIRYRAVMK